MSPLQDPLVIAVMVLAAISVTLVLFLSKRGKV